MIKKRRHHILPRFYLEGFTSPLKKSILYQYEKGNSKIVKTTPENAAVIKDYYSFDDPPSEEVENMVEEILAIVESYSAPVLEKIKEKEEIDDEDRENFSIFLAYMFTRVPHHRQMTEEIYGKGMKSWLMALASHKEGFKSEMKKYEENTGKKIDVPFEKLRKFLADESKYEVRPHPNISLDFVSFGLEIAPIFQDMKWSFLEATENYKYLTSDNPIYYFDPTAPPGQGIGLINENIEVYFPVSRDLMFFGCWHNVQGYKKSENNSIKNRNKNTIVNASRFVYSPHYSKGINKIVQKFIGSAPKIEVTWAGKTL